MGKLLISFITMMFSTLAIANPYHHGHRHHHHRHWHSPPIHHWVVPAIIGGAVFYAATRPDPIVIQQTPTVIQNQYVVIDGVTYKKEIMIINGVTQEILIKQQ